MPAAYDKRQKRLREWMERENVDACFLMMSGDLQYLTGVMRQPHNSTDDNKHGDELYGALFTRERGPVFLVPRMGASEYVRNQAEGKPWVEDITVINDGDDPLRVASLMFDWAGKPKVLGVSGRLWARSMFRWQQVSKDIKFVDASSAISRMRAVKDEYEAGVMKRAGEITDSVFSQVLSQMRRGMTEYELVSLVNHEIIRQGGSGVSFHTTVTAAGEGIATEYCADGKTRNTKIKEGAVVAFDFGIIYQGYVSDFGRTVFVGEPSTQYRHYHDTVMRSQAEAIGQMKPGQVTAARLNEIARKVLRDEGLDQFFTHRLGHGIGIDVHEPPFLYELDHTVLEEGMCFTIEPSVRVPGSVCVRVEDVVMVTGQGGLPFSNFSRDYLVI